MKGVVAAGDGRTADAAAQLLRQGGNAIDAALAGVCASFVAEPVLTGPLGGGFVMADVDGVQTAFDCFADVPGRGASQSGDALDFREVIVNFGPTTQPFHVGKGAVAVPTLMPGLLKLHAQLGKKDISDVVVPAVKLARQGVMLTPQMAGIVRILEPILRLTPEAESIYAPFGHLIDETHTLKNPELADFLERLPHDDSLATLQSICAPPHGLITPEDLEGTSAVERAPLALPMGAYELALNPAPASGGALLGFGLALLSHAPQETWEDDVATLRYFLAAQATMNAARAGALSIEALHENGEQTTQHFVSTDFVGGWLNSLHHMAEHGPTPASAEATLDLGSTTHISVVDGQGGACAITSSNGEGCGHMIPGTGAMANNFMGEEDLHPHGFHAQHPGTRLTSMMSPLVIRKEGKPWLTLGTGGSNRIRTALLQVVARILFRHESLEQAVGAPRIHFEQGVLNYEVHGPARALTDDERNYLLQVVKKQVAFSEPNMFFGGVHAACTNGQAAGDPRRGGSVTFA